MSSFLTYGTEQRQKVVAYARAQIGKNYCWLGDGTEGCYDCSGLALEAWKQAGLVFPGHQVADIIRFVRGSYSPLTDHNYTRHGYVKSFSPDTRDRLLLGDLVLVYGDVYQPDSVTHCGIFSGFKRVGLRPQRQMVAAVSTQYGVIETAIDWGGTPSGFAFIGH